MVDPAPSRESERSRPWQRWSERPHCSSTALCSSGRTDHAYSTIRTPKPTTTNNNNRYIRIITYSIGRYNHAHLQTDTTANKYHLLLYSGVIMTITKPRYQEEEVTTKDGASDNLKIFDVYLPSTQIGKILSIGFFVLLFTLCEPTVEGYNTFRKCHGNCMNGILHSVGMPIAVSGVFCIVRGLSNYSEFTRQLQCFVTTLYVALYVTYEPNKFTPWLFYILYMSIFEFILYRKIYQNKSNTRCYYIILGVSLVFVNVSTLEVIGHGYYEHHHSYVTEFFNSVFHTPLYGINSIIVELFKQYKKLMTTNMSMMDVQQNALINLNSTIDQFLQEHQCW